MNNRRLRFIVPAAVILLILLILLARCAGTPRDAAVSGDVSAGIAYLEALDRRDPGEVDQTLKAIELQELKDKRDEKLRQMRSGEVSVWSLFHDYVIMGDSRAVGFTFLQTLDNSRILGHYGDGSDEIHTHYEALKELNPSYIFLSYGLDDMLQVGCETPESFAQLYLERLEDLQAHCPDAKIFVSPVFPCTDPAFDSYEPRKKWRETESYTEALRNILQGTGFYYISCDNITDYTPYWVEDGIHFNAEFYEIWSENMIMAMYDAELGLDSSEASDVPSGQDPAE